MYAYVPGLISMVQEHSKSSSEATLTASLMYESEGSDLVQYFF